MFDYKAHRGKCRSTPTSKCMRVYDPKSLTIKQKKQKEQQKRKQREKGKAEKKREKQVFLTGGLRERRVLVRVLAIGHLQLMPRAQILANHVVPEARLVVQIRHFLQNRLQFVYVTIESCLPRRKQMVGCFTE